MFSPKKQTQVQGQLKNKHFAKQIRTLKVHLLSQNSLRVSFPYAFQLKLSRKTGVKLSAEMETKKQQRV